MVAVPFALKKGTIYQDIPLPDSLFIAHQALWALGAQVSILDIQECQKAIVNGAHFDFVLELSGYGINSNMNELLSTLCGSMGIGYFPSSGLARKIATNKLIAKRFAAQAGLKIPATIIDLPSKNDKILVCKPIFGGDSLGVEVISTLEQQDYQFKDNKFFEEFIDGVDVTILTFYESVVSKNQIVGAFENTDSSGEIITTYETKKIDQLIYGRTKRTRRSVFDKINSDTIKGIHQFLDILGNPKVCRFDFRLSKETNSYYFLEANIDPTFGNNGIWYEPLKCWSVRSRYSQLMINLSLLPIHRSAVAIAFLISIDYM